LCLSWFHVGAIAILGFLGVVTHLMSLRPGHLLARWPWNMALAAFIGIVAMAGVAHSGALSEGLGWILTSDKFMASVLESQSFFVERGRFSISGALLMLTGIFPVALIGVVVILAEQWRTGFADGRRLFLAFLTLTMFVMLAKQRRFGADFGPAMAVVTAYMAVNVATRRGGSRRGSRLIAGALTAVVLLSASGPFLWQFVIRPQFSSAAVTQDHYQRKNRFLARLRDITSGSRMGGGEGVMSHWDLGHKIMYITGMGVVANNFGLHIGHDSYRDWSAFFLSTSEAAGSLILDRRNVRYVVSDFDLGALKAAALYMGLDPAGYYTLTQAANGRYTRQYGPEFFQTLFFRLTAAAGSQMTIQTGTGTIEVPALGGFRLILDSERDDKPGYLKAWQKVMGARILLAGPPLAEVSVVYEFTSASGRRRVYSRSIRLDDEGKGRMIAPYSSDRPDLGHVSKYRITHAGGVAALFVKESQVLGGEALEVNLGVAP
ncbi:MAG: hypothetical protein OEZ04_11510, partial [Nitrospinota bacterium]|nr:hypothetical protein [Nitrospinota bacterium]